MTLKRNLVFWETHVPPRCRKPRTREVRRDFTTTIAEVTADQAPVAIRMKRSCPSIKTRGYGTNEGMEYCWHNGQLYVSVRLSRFATLNQRRDRAATPRDMYLTRHYGFSRSEEDTQAHFDEWAEPWLLVDGRLHEQIDEPRFVIMTFGLGHNHGLGWGTSLSVDHHYNCNIHRDRYFRIDQEEAARLAGRQIAENRGDTNALPHFDQRLYDRYSILIPDAIRLNPRQEHGTGCDFINKAEAVISGSENHTYAGLGLMGLLAKDIASSSATP